MKDSAIGTVIMIGLLLLLPFLVEVLTRFGDFYFSYVKWAERLLR
jgi:hypothetical protein